MSALLDIATGMTRSWVSLYTSGLPPEFRDSRRAEIDSDVWEQQRTADLLNQPQGETSLQLLARLVLGIPSDVTWRLETGRSARSERSISMNEALYMRAMVAAGVVLALFLILSGVASIADALVQGDLASGQAAFGAISVVAGAAVGSGLLTSRRNPLLGIGLVAAGAITVAAAWYWMLVITVPIGIALVAITYFRARPALRRPEPGPA
ncbi:MAG: hypothetical protein Q8Q00_07280 [Dehalococcoidia bacterium]|nr:hypothetical protein [Dehalococcoidia bacterium]